jgi:CrcB protein
MVDKRAREVAVSAAAWVAVGLLGGAAAAARYLIDTAVTARTDHPFPHGILAVNIAGALALGLVAGAALEGQALVVVAGGGIGWLNLGLSLLAGFAAVALGHWLGGAL